MASAAACGGYPCPDVDVNVDGNPSPGSTVPVVGGNWCPNSTVSIYLDGVFQGTATTNDQGSFTFDLKLSNAIASGQHTVTVVGYDASCTTLRSATAIITIAGGEGGRGALPFTGSNISVAAMLLVALVLVGAVALVAGRRREQPVVEEK